MSAHDNTTTMPSFLALSKQTNPSASSIHLTNGATDWLWAVFAVMALSDLAVIIWSHKVSCNMFLVIYNMSLTHHHSQRSKGQRVFHQLPIIILTTSAIAYYVMASSQGHAGVDAGVSGNILGSHPMFDVFVIVSTWYMLCDLI
jgi:bacteriorhodopsin